MDAMLNIYLTMDPHGLLSTCFYTVLRKFGRETACAPLLTLTFEKFGAVKVAAIIVSKKSTQCWTLHFCSLSSLSWLQFCNVLHLKPGRQVSCVFTFRPNQAIRLKAQNSTTSMNAMHCKDFGVNNPIQATTAGNKRIANLGVYVCPFVCTQLVAVAALPLCSWSWGDFQSIVLFADAVLKAQNLASRSVPVFSLCCFASALHLFSPRRQFSQPKNVLPWPLHCLAKVPVPTHSLRGH